MEPSKDPIRKSFCDESITVQAFDSSKEINDFVTERPQLLTDDLFRDILNREKNSENNESQSIKTTVGDGSIIETTGVTTDAQEIDIDFEQFNSFLQEAGGVPFSKEEFIKSIIEDVKPIEHCFFPDSAPNYQGQASTLSSVPSFSETGQTNCFLDPAILDKVLDIISPTISRPIQTPTEGLHVHNTTKASTTNLSKVPARTKCTNCSHEYNPACRQHNCQSCKQKTGGFNALICQSCGSAHHIACMAQPLLNLYQNPWHCQICQPNRVVSSDGNSLYVGKVPGILVGSSWKYQMQLNYNHLHRPSMAGIHGTGDTPAYSIVLQGGYEKDDDLGVDFYYTGAGGRDDRGVHIKNQELKTVNLSLASSCDADLNFEGATAHDWTKSAPIRVIRGAKLKKHKSQYAPNNFRYDGIYKLVRYWKEKIPEGFDIWRFHLRRDDIEPAPWTPEGEQYIIDNNILFEYSDPIKPVPKISGASPKHLSKKLALVPKSPAPLVARTIVKPKASLITPQVSEWVIEGFHGAEEVSKIHPVSEMEADSEVSAGNTSMISTVFTTLNPFIIRDIRNQKLWSDICSDTKQSLPQFLDKVRHTFMCTVCFDLVEPSYPCTTVCGHNFCRACFRATIRQNMELCPVCKTHIPRDCMEGSDASSQVITNHALADILLILKPALDDDLQG